MNKNKQSGIYRIKNLETGAMYIGQTSQFFGKRWGEHRRDLRAGRHYNAHIQRSYDKHGPDAFEYRALEVIPRGDMSDKEFNDYLNEREIILIDEHDAFSNGYNQTDGGGGLLGLETSEATRAKISAAKKGKKIGPMSEATKAKIRAGNKGKTLSTEHRAKLSKAGKGRKASAETRAKLSAAHMGQTSPNKGKALSEAHKANLSAANKGKPWSTARRTAEEARKNASIT